MIWAALAARACLQRHNTSGMPRPTRPQCVRIVREPVRAQGEERRLWGAGVRAKCAMVHG
jgi:hypothetical protein